MTQTPQNTADRRFERKSNEEVKYETLTSAKYEWNNNWISVERRRATPKDGKPNTFIALSRGYYSREGSPKTKTSVTLPDSKEVRDFVAEKLMGLS